MSERDDQPRNAPRQQRRGDTREVILARALELFVAHGLGRVSTRQIAAAVGISQPSLYAHFATRDDIAVELCRRAFALLRDRMAAAAAEAEDPRGRLEAIGRTYVAFGLENEAAYRVAFMLEFPPADAAYGRVLEEGTGAFAVLRGALDGLGLDPDTAETAAQSAWMGLHGLVSLFLARPHFPFVERDRLVAFHLHALSAWLDRGRA